MHALSTLLLFHGVPSPARLQVTNTIHTHTHTHPFAARLQVPPSMIMSLLICRTCLSCLYAVAHITIMSLLICRTCLSCLYAVAHITIMSLLICRTCLSCLYAVAHITIMSLLICRTCLSCLYAVYVVLVSRAYMPCLYGVPSPSLPPLAFQVLKA
jgi:hypothetical protein